MSYTIVGPDGSGQHIASVQGMVDVINFVKRVDMRGALMNFLNDGETSNIPEVMRDIDLVIPYATSLDVKATLLMIKKALNKTPKWAGIG